MKVIPYGRQCITEEDIAAVADALRSDYLTQGPRITEFERKFADYVGAPEGVAVSNANPAAKEAADYVTARSNDEDAIAEVISRFVI